MIDSLIEYIMSFWGGGDYFIYNCHSNIVRVTYTGRL